LYHIHFDHAQQHNVIDLHPDQHERLQNTMRSALRKLDVPQEQYIRLGLEREDSSHERATPN